MIGSLRSALGLDPALLAYVRENNPTEAPALSDLRRATAKIEKSQMQISPEQGLLLQFLVRLCGARRILELGTYTGYSALCFALALPEEGRVVTCDVSSEWTSIGRQFWTRAGVSDKIDLRLGPALETLATLETSGGKGAFDLAFVDADKPSYGAYYEACLRLVRAGGLVILDNMLRRGRVVDPAASDPDAHLVRALNAKISKDERVDRVLLPIADGMTLVRLR